jgi:hypothetical protein
MPNAMNAARWYIGLSGTLVSPVATERKG